MSSKIIIYSKKFTLSLLLVACIGVNADARNCSKGKPCGNSCISKNDVCHKDSTATASEKVKSVMNPTVPEAPANQPVEATQKTFAKAKNCSKGKSCGNSCIPKDAVCSVH